MDYPNMNNVSKKHARSHNVGPASPLKAAQVILLLRLVLLRLGERYLCPRTPTDRGC